MLLLATSLFLHNWDGVGLGNADVPCSCTPAWFHTTCRFLVLAQSAKWQNWELLEKKKVSISIFVDVRWNSCFVPKYLCFSQIGACKNAGSVFNPAVCHRLGQRLKPCSQSLEDFAWDLQPVQEWGASKKICVCFWHVLSEATAAYIFASITLPYRCGSINRHHKDTGPCHSMSSLLFHLPPGCHILWSHATWP